jgi:hypothetical protein
METTVAKAGSALAHQRDRGSMVWLRTIAVALALGGCNTPSVPIPPPQPDLQALRVQPVTTPAGMVTVEGQPSVHHESVRYYIFNVSRADGVIVDAHPDGSFSTSPFPGSEGDTLQLYFDAPDRRRSTTVCTTLSLNAPLISSSCP